MNYQAIQMLQWAREKVNLEDAFSRGYICGVFNTQKMKWEPWERQYVQNIIDHRLFGKREAV